MFSDSLGGGKEMAVGLQDLRDVAAGDTEQFGDGSESAFRCIQPVQQQCRQRDVSHVLLADLQLPRDGRNQLRALRRHEETGRHRLGQRGRGVQRSRGSASAGDVHPKPPDGIAPVRVLRTRIVGDGRHFAGSMSQPDGRRDLVAMLPTGA